MGEAPKCLLELPCNFNDSHILLEITLNFLDKYLKSWFKRHHFSGRRSPLLNIPFPHAKPRFLSSFPGLWFVWIWPLAGSPPFLP